MELLPLLLASPLPLLIMLAVTAVLWWKRLLTALTWVLIAWAALTVAGCVWFSGEADRLAARGIMAVDGGFINTINTAMVGGIGIVVGLLARLNLEGKSSSKETK